MKTLVHELMHGLMDQAGPARSRHLQELEAESGAFLVCNALGLDTGQYSFAYLAAWAGDPEEVLPAAERAAKVADELLESLDVEGLGLAPNPSRNMLGRWASGCDSAGAVVSLA